MPGRQSAKVKATLTEVESQPRLCWHGTTRGDRVFTGTPEGSSSIHGRTAPCCSPCVEEIIGRFFPMFWAEMWSAVQHHDNLSAGLKSAASDVCPVWYATVRIRGPFGYDEFFRGFRRLARRASLRFAADRESAGPAFRRARSCARKD